MTGETRGASTRVAESQHGDAAIVACDAGEGAGVGGEVPGGEEAGAGEVVEGFPDCLESKEVDRVENPED